MNTPLSPAERDRLFELLADEHFGMLTSDDRAELEALHTRAGDEPDLSEALGQLVLAIDAHEVATAGPGASMPAAMRARLTSAPAATRTAPSPANATSLPAALPFEPRPRSNRSLLFAIAASILLLLSAGVLLMSAAEGRTTRQLLAEERARGESARLELAALERQAADNRELLAESRLRAQQLAADLASRDETLASAAAREVDLLEQLALATEDLDAARLAIARYETPTDPAELAQNRRKLLDFPDTVRIVWSPFDLPDNPAEQPGVSGDVVWNDELQQGYLRFVGLDANDPAIEQYQVWVIDDRGLEQKVSGGVFNATAEGEVIVPIKPGIDVRRVALFAVTIEEPGGTWVPDLRRRVVIAPRDG
jgi:anti-sigma-K factor RskA